MIYPSLDNDNLVEVLRLVRTPNVGPITLFKLIKRFGNAGKALVALPDLARAGGKKTPLAPYALEDAEKEITATEKFGAKIVVYGSEDYPELLLNVQDAPPVIIVKGDRKLWQNKKTLAMVGARNASAASCQFAARLAKELGEHGLIVVSGLARGIDTFAHKGSLATGTVAVIAGGIDSVYPPENAELYQKIAGQGSIICEQAIGTVPFAGSFPSRNRIIAGMSFGTLVVEASLKSGSLITARLALENNREVFAVPNSPLDPRSRGCNQLIRQGAVLTESVDDILQVLETPRQISFSLSESPHESFAEEVSESEIEKLREVITSKLGITPVSIDELVEQCEARVSTVQSVIMELELAGTLRRSAGNKVSIAV